MWDLIVSVPDRCLYFYFPSQCMFIELNLLPFPKRVQYHTCIMGYKAMNGLAPEYTNELSSKRPKCILEIYVQLIMNS